MKFNMFLFIQPSQFHIQNIYFLEKKINMIMDGYFTKFVFSNQYMTMNGLFFKLPQVTISPNFLTIDTIYNKEWIQRLCMIERQILQYYQMFNISYDTKRSAIQKTPIYILKTQLQKGVVKYYRDLQNGHSEQPSYYVKISGIWESQYEIGITFKIIEYRRI